MSEPPAPHDERLVRALRALNSELTGSNRAVAAQLGLNESDLAVLDILHREGPQTPSVLARRTRMGATTMTSVLHRLSRGGWVERRPTEQDLRSFTIHATGVDRLAQVYLAANQRFAALLADRSPAEVELLVGFLAEAAGVVRQSVAELDDHPPRA